MTSRGGPKGIGGWLLLPLIQFTFLVPISCFLYRGAGLLNEIVAALLATFSLIAGISLWAKQRFAVGLAKAYILICWIMTVAGAVLGHLPHLVWIAVGGAIPTLIWYGYFENSRRVRNTYFETKSQESNVYESAAFSPLICPACGATNPWTAIVCKCGYSLGRPDVESTSQFSSTKPGQYSVETSIAPPASTDLISDKVGNLTSRLDDETREGLVADLRRLAELRLNGLLTEDEYAAAKRSILGSQDR